MTTRVLITIVLFLAAALPAAPLHAGESMAATVRLNVRGGPGLDHPILDTLAAGERVLVNDCRGEWCRITHVGISGWVFSPYLVAASFSQSWRAISRDLPATLRDGGFVQPDIGVTLDVDPRAHCPLNHPLC
ncbi:MAG: SH3 domain-containing protein [Alphaproteobacteria bacterium]|nr:SH3 domain-containing protein [Alphaproteobacteria bacterium]